MPATKNFKNKLSIRSYPQEILVHEEKSELTVGDMHGNALRLLQWLIQQGVFKLKSNLDKNSTWQKLYNKYMSLAIGNTHSTDDKEKKAERRATEVDAYIALIKTSFDVDNSKQYVLRFLGDMLCDRGASDKVILAIIQLLQKNEVSYCILLSNHDADHILRRQGYQPYIPKDRVDVYRSYLNDSHIFEKDTTKNNIYGTCYAPFIKAIDVKKDDRQKKIYIFTHAPIDMMNINDFIVDVCKLDRAIYTENNGKKFVNFDDLDQYIKEINKMMMTDFVSLDGDLNLEFGERDHLMIIAWQVYGDMQFNNDITIIHNNETYTVEFVHGHVGGYRANKANMKDTDPLQKYTNLDTNLGKYPRCDLRLLIYVHTGRHSDALEKFCENPTRQGHEELLDYYSKPWSEGQIDTLVNNSQGFFLYTQQKIQSRVVSHYKAITNKKRIVPRFANGTNKGDDSPDYDVKDNSGSTYTKPEGKFQGSKNQCP